MKTALDLIAAGDLRGKRVLVRCDLNVPQDADTTITDDGRVRASLPTIKALSEAGARVVVCAHLGRPKGAPEARYSLAPVAKRLQELLGHGRKGVSGLGCPFGPAEAGARVVVCAHLAQSLDGGQRSPHPTVVGDGGVGVLRDVQVTTDQDPFPAEVSGRDQVECGLHRVLRASCRRT